MIIPQRAFSSGVLSPGLYARADFYRYFTGLKIGRNGYIKRSGGFESRPGTEFISEVKDSTKRTRFIPFVFNSSQTYVLEFGDLYFRVIKNGVSQKLTAQAITAVTNANPAVATYTGADTLTAGDHVYLSTFNGSLGDYLNGRTLRVGTVDTGANTFQLLNLDGTNFNSASLPAYTSGGQFEEIYTVTTTYALADLPDLKFAQSGDVITITHPSYPPREIARTGDTSWTITTITFGPATSVLTLPTATKFGAAGAVSWFYVITKVDPTTYEESLQVGDNVCKITNGVDPLTRANYVQVTWGGAAAGDIINVYKGYQASGPYGYIGQTMLSGFDDYGYTPDFSDPPPNDTKRSVFDAANKYPSCVLYAQQRRFFANINNNTEVVYGSKVGFYKNFEKQYPITDDIAVDFSLAGNQVNSIRHMVDLGNLILLTDSGEKVVQGNQSGIITPTEINLRQYSYNGSANNPAPIIIDNTALFVQNGGSIIRDLGYDISVDGYKGNDLTLFSNHFFDGYTIDRWAFQKNPNSTVWAVRSDGALLSLTYLKDQQMLAWTEHDTGDDIFEDVCSVQNGSDYDVYFCIKRTINGATKRYIERMSSRFFTNDKDYNFTDCSLAYDGRNTGSTTMDLSTSSVWTAGTLLTLTASASYFASTDVGNQIHYYDTDDKLVLILDIVAYTSATAVSVRPKMDVASAYQGAVTNWARAVDSVTGLWHLEAENVSVIGDGFVVASPNNPAYTVKTVTNGALSFNRCYAVIRAGIPYVSDLETLSIDSANSSTIVNKKVLIGKVALQVEKTRGVWVGSRNPDESNLNSDDDLLYGLNELKVRDFEVYNEGTSLLNGKADITIESSWNDNGRVFIRQVDPLPMTILSVCPEGVFPFNQNG